MNFFPIPAHRLFTRPFVSGAVVAAMLVGCFAITSVSAQQTATKLKLDAVAFVVNGKEYTNRDLSIASIDFATQLERVEPSERREALINILIDMLLLADEGKREKLDGSDDFKRRMDHLAALNLRNFYIREKLQPLVTEELLQDEYVETLARFEPEPQIRARHILVDTEDAAVALIQELAGGKDFAELAKEKSTGPSAPNGGDLGFFSEGQMVAPFQKAAEQLKKGEYSRKPIKTQFGWHVIMVEDTRQSEAPKYEEVANELSGRTFGRLFQAKVVSLRKKADVKLFNNDGEEIKP